MNFLERLLGRGKDPTLKWKPFSPPIPDFDLTDMRFGSLRFGDGYEAAAFLGRPNRCEWMQGCDCTLLYASGGFEIGFDKDRLISIAFFIGPDELLPKDTALEFAKPRLRGCTPDGVQLSPEVDQRFVEQLFGAAESIDADADETILFYTREGVGMDFELDGKNGRLKRWNLYLKDVV